MWVEILWQWLDLMATQPAPLQERMALFWHGHFCSEQRKVYDARALWKQNQLFRRQGMGNFHTLAQAVAVDPAMLLYLDNAYNVAGYQQENFGRELMELFLIGPSHFTQADVVDMTRAWTGHGLGSPWVKLSHFYKYFPERHDNGWKTVFGRRGRWNGPALINEICYRSRQGEMARFIVTKLWSYFAYPNPPAALVEALAAQFVGHALDVRALLRAMFLHDEFWGAAARAPRPLSPVEHVVSVMRATGLPAATVHPEWYLAGMGQELFNPPNVAGWRSGFDWVAASSLSWRASFDRAVAYSLGPESGFPIQSERLRDPASTPVQLADLALGAFNVTDPSQTTRSMLADWLAKHRLYWWAPECVNVAVMMSPDFNLG